MQFQKFYFGTTYYPERYPENAELLREDADLLARLHMNTVILSASTILYAAMEPGGKWLSGILDLLSGAGVSVGIELPVNLPETWFLLSLDSDPRVIFFQTEKCGKDRALELARVLKEMGISKPVAIQIPEESLFDTLSERELVDVVCFSHRPDWTGSNLQKEGRRMAFLEDRARCLTGTSFFMTGIDPMYLVNERGRKLKRPGLLTLEIFQAGMHGARGIFLSDLRQAVAGPDRYAGAVIAHSGRLDTENIKELEQIGRMFGEVREMASTCVDARCAVWCGEDADLDRVFRTWSAIRLSGISVDLIDGSSEIGGYVFVVACGARRVSEEKAELIRAYIEGGGVFLAEWGFATEDAVGRCYRGAVPHGLMDVFGLEVTEAEELYPDEKTALFVPSDFKGKYSARGIMECIENHGADVMVRYASGPYQDFPALLRKQVGEGFAYYLGTDCGDTLLKALCEKILKVRRGVAPMKMEEGIAVQRLFGEAAEYLVFQNYTDKVQKLPLVYNKLDILFGFEPVSAFGAFVLRVPKKK